MRAIVLAAFLAPAVVLAQEANPASQAAPKQKLDVHPTDGPAKIDLGHELALDLPAGFVFLNAMDAKAVMSSMGNVPSEKLIGLIAKSESKWFVLVEFDPAGYVKDDEAGKLDAQAILDSIREGTEQANAYRKEHGFEVVEVVGWSEKPAYDKAVHHVTWAIEGKDTKGHIVNVNTRVLGRHGYASLNLVGAPDELPVARPELAKLLAATTFTKGARYEDFEEGHDKVAEYGLAALVAGGAGALALKAVKVGLLAKFGGKILALLFAAKKAIVLLIAGGVAAVRRFFGGGKAGTPPATPPSGEPPPPTVA